MGHIQLASPVSHIWYFKGTPSRLGILLDISPRNLERILYFALYIVTWVDEDARLRLLQQLDDEAEGRGGRAGKDLAEMEDQLRSELNRTTDELNAGLAQFKLEREEERTTRTAELVDKQQATKAILDALGSGTAEEPIVFEPTGEVIVASGDKSDKAAQSALNKAAAAEVERVNQEIQQREANEEDSVRRQIEDARLQLDASLEAERERLRSDAEGTKDDVKRARDEINRIQPGLMLPETTLDGMNFRDLDRKYGSGVRGGARLFGAGMGAEAVRELIERMDLDELGQKLHSEVRTTSGQRRKKAIKRLRLIEAFRRSGNRPEWMILSVLPVIPPDLRPMVQLDGGRFATSDLNDLYRRVINRNNRLKRLLELGAPEIIIRNEKRMLQEACDALIDNGRRGRSIVGTGNHRLKSLSDMLKGKQGRFRQNLLGKRVDYSGRSVIVAGPSLRLHQCGLPKLMALELFKPFIMSRLVERKAVQNIKAAKKMVDSMIPEVWDVLEEVIQEHPVLLNRAPTLHRLGIQAFEPQLVEGKAIQVHPLVCSAFNADFDGDQMAVHVPLSAEAQAEARILMLSSNNILSPAHGSPLATPTQDMVLGIYYITYGKSGEELVALDEALKAGDWDEKVNGSRPRTFRSAQEAELAFENGLVKLHDFAEYRRPEHEHFLTTVGRIIFNDRVERALADALEDEWDPEKFDFVNETLKKRDVNRMVEALVEAYGASAVSLVLDAYKELGFHFATQAGITVSKNDVISPPNKEEILEGYEKQAAEIVGQYNDGWITAEERKDQVTRTWDAATDEVAQAMEDNLDELNPIFMMANSGARGSFKQIRQLAGMRGLMANPKGEIIERPIKANFMEGLDVLEYFISTHGARKGLADTALRTADSGYLTRRLVDVSQDVIVNTEDCKTKDFVEMPVFRDPGEPNPNLLGRRAAKKFETKRGRELLKRNKEIDKAELAELAEAFAGETDAKVPVRSVLKCELPTGICQACYGRALATGSDVELGDAVGIIAAQSIGEPGTQLTMRTFHTGGVAGLDITQGLPRIVELFEARKPKGLAQLALEDGKVAVEETDKGTKLVITDSQGEEHAYSFPPRTVLLVENGAKVSKGDQLNEGSLYPAEILEVRGRTETELYLVAEVQKVYRAQGVDINDKHIELIVRQMLKKVRVDSKGSTELLPGQLEDRVKLQQINKQVKADGGTPAKGEEVILGITKASLATESFLSAASFQETTKVLTDAALEGKRDRLVGLKENVIIGKLIPAATGLRRYRTIEIEPVEPPQRPDEALDDAELAAELGLGADGEQASGADVEGFGSSFADELEELASEIETTEGNGSGAAAGAEAETEE
jgi:DNA-directed RNA polymerase subunit beta'